eukprot:12938489-Alexandrium_andersonii.AAC.1
MSASLVGSEMCIRDRSYVEEANRKRRWGDAWFSNHGDADPVHPSTQPGQSLDIENPCVRPKMSVDAELSAHPYGSEELMQELAYHAELWYGHAKLRAVRLDVLQNKDFPPAYVSLHVIEYEEAKHQYQEAIRAVHRFETARGIDSTR